MAQDTLEQRVGGLETSLASLQTNITYIVKKLDELGNLVQTITRMEERHAVHTADIARLNSRIETLHEQHRVLSEKTNSDKEKINEEVGNVKDEVSKWKHVFWGVVLTAMTLWTVFGGYLTYLVQPNN